MAVHNSLVTVRPARTWSDTYLNRNRLDIRFRELKPQQARRRRKAWSILQKQRFCFERVHVQSRTSSEPLMFAKISSSQQAVLKMECRLPQTSSDHIQEEVILLLCRDFYCIHYSQQYQSTVQQHETATEHFFSHNISIYRSIASITSNVFPKEIEKNNFWYCRVLTLQKLHPISRMVYH